MSAEPETLDLTTTWEVVSVDAASGLATVRFDNPYYSGASITPHTRPVLDAEGEPTGQVETYMVDEDPNLPATKAIPIPLTDAGAVDHPAFVARLLDQARGVRRRMDTARACQEAGGLGALVGLTTPSP